ncbi:general substrate transporter [Laetiporus sulphureus 93-53]|uniref:General substrate transporter n=1 Tax=Laetiporus sulphureus 93-53 TaxID=1314785 RepID=A0A165FDS6_9APHY|nr:general substrate transporter [Laetiporus sulphureus 93-53]KZT08817.1 general substrate transporter [Laetiporus sulphureus 93-53]
MAIPSNRRAILLAIFIAFGGFLFGYDIGVISGCLIMDDFVERFGQQNSDGSYTLSSSRQSIITSLLSAGTIVGSLGQAFTSDRFGRRGSILMWSFIFTIGTVIQTSTVHSIAQLVVGRFVAGLGVGALSAIVPLYNGETAPKALRGMLIVLYQVQIIMGIFFSYLVDLGTHHLKGSAEWRIPVGLQMLWGLILLSGIFFLPESPRHLLGTGREDEARQVIAELNSVPVDDQAVVEIIDELEYGIHAENDGGKATWLECFSTRNMLWKRTVNGMMLQFIQQLNGQNFYYYYGDTFFKSAGTDLSSYVIQVILGAVSVAGTLPALYLIDTLGRRRSLMTGAAFEACCALIAGLAGHFMLAPSGTPQSELTARNKTGGNVLIAFAVLHVFAYSIFWGPTPWVYLGESFPLRVRPKCIALGSATNWVWNFLLSLFSPRIADDIGPLILLVFAGMLAFGFCYVCLFIPETKGLSLEEVDEMYRAKVLPWKSSGWRPSEKHLHDKVEMQTTEVREEKEKSEVDA